MANPSNNPSPTAGEPAPPGVVVTEDLAIVSFRGRTGGFLDPMAGAPSLDVLRMVREELRLPLREALGEARTTERAVHRGVPARSGEASRAIDIEVIPFVAAPSTERLFVVSFRDVIPAMTAGAPPSSPDAALAAQRLERSEAALRRILVTASQPILMSTVTGTIAFANDAVARVFGYGPEEMIGLHVEDLVPARDRSSMATSRPRVFDEILTKVAPTRREAVACRKDGSEFAIEIALSATEGAEGPLVVSFLTDLTAQKEEARRIQEYQDSLQRMAFEAAAAEERARRRIAADLHDRIGQSLALARIKLTNAQDAASGDPRTAIDASIALITQAITEARTLTFELSPPVLYDLGLKPALSWLTEEMERVHGIRCEVVSDDGAASFDETTSALLFRAVRELLTNVLKHARTPTARISLRRRDDHCEIEVADDGVGFDAAAIAGAGIGPGFGLFSIREQIHRLGGKLEVSSATSKGTRVTLSVPVIPMAEGAASTKEPEA